MAGYEARRDADTRAALDDYEKVKADRDALADALRATAGMLAYEATCHEESGDAKRRTYVASLRAQVAVARAVLDEVYPE